MSNLESLHLFRIGAHASNTDWTTIPGTLLFVEPDTPAQITAGYNLIDVRSQRADGQLSPRILGAKTIGATFSMPVRGVSGSGAGDTETVAAGNLDAIKEILDALTGVTMATSTGSTSNASGNTGTTITFDDGLNDLAVGDGVMFAASSTDARVNCREVVTKTEAANDSVVVDRAPTDSAGTAVNCANTTTVFASGTWFLDPTAADRTHLGIDYEREDGRRQIVGMLGNLVFQVPQAGKLVAQVTLQGTDWSDVADANPAFTAQTAGDIVTTMSSHFWIGGTEYLAYDHQIDLGVQLQPRRSDGGPNGFHGFVVTGHIPTWSFKLHRGSLSRQAADSVVNTLQGTTAQDIALQVGETAGAAVYFRAPAADIEANEASENGIDIIQCNARLTRSGNHANVPGALRIHIF